MRNFTRTSHSRLDLLIISAKDSTSVIKDCPLELVILHGKEIFFNTFMSDIHPNKYRNKIEPTMIDLAIQYKEALSNGFLVTLKLCLITWSSGLTIGLILAVTGRRQKKGRLEKLSV